MFVDTESPSWEAEMLCSQPVTAVTSTGPQLVGCGQCFNCDVNKRRAWTARLMLEGLACEDQNQHVTWTTLTYDPEAIPMASRGAASAPVQTLRSPDYQRVFKLLRKRDRIGSFRFALCGEYGDKTGRPHYHALIYGPDPGVVEHWLRKEWDSEYGFTTTRPWRVGQTQGDAAMSRAAYLANYVTKKMHQVDSKNLDLSQQPEFFRCSKKPPLGYSKKLWELLHTTGGEISIAETGDVPSTVRIAGRQWPLARVLREHLREDLGIPQRMLERHQLIKPTRPRRQPTAEDYYRAKQQSKKLQRTQSRSAFAKL